jgi:hypothetical protein
MSVEKAIYERWTGFMPLLSLVPADRLYTGKVPDRDPNDEEVVLPYVGVLAMPKQSTQRTSSGNIITNGVVKFAVFAETLGDWKRIVRAIVSCFNRADFDWSQGKMLDMKPGTEDYDEDADDGVWEGEQVFDFTLLQRA